MSEKTNLSLSMVELYHNKGWMPNWAYYQQNGKSAMENYAEQTNKNTLFSYEEDDDYSSVHITSEVNIKK
ncbi:MAG: hypothetical protein IJH28_01820 [Mogibacterium sp.]|nr:hypothetical protein [Mogibacterium sp.]